MIFDTIQMNVPMSEKAKKTLERLAALEKTTEHDALVLALTDTKFQEVLTQLLEKQLERQANAAWAANVESKVRT